MSTENFSANNLDSVPPSTYYSVIKEKDLQPTSTTIFEKLLLSKVEVNNVSNYIAYCVGHHGLLLASEDFYLLLTLYEKFKKMDPRICL